jgi:hypothetical protein
MRTEEAPVANLFGLLQGVTQNKRSSIPDPKGEDRPHTREEKARGHDATCIFC